MLGVLVVELEVDRVGRAKRHDPVGLGDLPDLRFAERPLIDAHCRHPAQPGRAGHADPVRGRGGVNRGRRWQGRDQLRVAIEAVILAVLHPGDMHPLVGVDEEIGDGATEARALGIIGIVVQPAVDPPQLPACAIDRLPCRASSWKFGSPLKPSARTHSAIVNAARLVNGSLTARWLLPSKWKHGPKLAS